MSPRYESVWESSSAAAALARAALRPAALAYELGVRVRGALYDRGLSPIARAPLPVVSVGNLRVGGSGKTPLTLWLAERLVAAGRRPAVVTRGYGARTSPCPVVVVRDEALRVLSSRAPADAYRLVGVGDEHAVPADIADEALLLALRGGFPVVIAPDRVRGCGVAAELGCDVAILDDGFQHRRLHRDLDIVLTSAADADARVLPAGPLREPLAALRRADVVVATDDASPTGTRPSFRARQVARGLVTALGPGAIPRPLATLRNREVVAVAGIARPQRFLDMLVAAGAILSSPPRLFGDHHAYGAIDVSAVLRDAGSTRGIITTEKDLVKLARLVPGDARLEALRIDLCVDDEDALRDRVLAVIRRLDAYASGPHHR